MSCVLIALIHLCCVVRLVTGESGCLGTSFLPSLNVIYRGSFSFFFVRKCVLGFIFFFLHFQKGIAYLLELACDHWAEKASAPVGPPRMFFGG